MSSGIEQRELSCGARLVAEPIAGVSSVAVSWLLSAGTATDPPHADGYAALLSELIFRGAGGLDSRQLSDAFDRIGVQRHITVRSRHMALSASMVSDHVNEAIDLLTTTVQQPLLPEAALDPVRSLCLQSVKGLDDDPQHLAMVRLAQCHLPEPFNRSGYGQEEVLIGAGIDELREHWETRAVADGSIIAVAGNIQVDEIAERFDQALLGRVGQVSEIDVAAKGAMGRHHFEADASQVHLGIAFNAPKEADPTSMLQRLAIRVLSGSSSGRLFTEVRQKRSLCYSVGASYHSGRDRGYVTIYAGTTPERAHETLEVCQMELARMAQGVTEQEFQRAVIGLKSRLIMQGESTQARAGALAYDMDRLGHARSLASIADQIDEIDCHQLNEYLSKHPFQPETVVSLGSRDIQ
ncbi:MAG: pitrilysin family protein [Phycisphaerales bacterium]|nr:pitrilysin family protein [Phycisphaerales bacterium]